MRGKGTERMGASVTVSVGVEVEMEVRAHDPWQVTMLKNTISGVLTIYLYFMDIISDFQVRIN